MPRLWRGDRSSLRSRQIPNQAKGVGGGGGGGCDFSCLDVPTSSADKAVMTVKGDFEGGISSDKDI